MGLLHRDAARYYAASRLNLNVFIPGGCLAISCSVLVCERVLWIVKPLGIYVDDVGIIDRVAPSEILVVADGGKWGSKERSARHIPSFVAVNMAFIPLSGPKEGLVRVY